MGQENQPKLNIVQGQDIPQEWAEWYATNNEVPEVDKAILGELDMLARIVYCHYQDKSALIKLYPEWSINLINSVFGFENMKKLLAYADNPTITETDAYCLVSGDETWYRNVAPSLMERVPGIHEKLAANPNLIIEIAKKYKDFATDGDLERVDKSIVDEFFRWQSVQLVQLVQLVQSRVCPVGIVVIHTE